MDAEIHLLPRILVGLALGLVIGWERQHRHKPAGLRTHALVTFACALLVASAQLLLGRSPADTGDVGRVMQGILAGVGVIGAGAILRQGAYVTGLTTAATIWMAATIGIVVGAGFYILAVTATVLSFLVIDLLGWLEHRTEEDDESEDLEAHQREIRRRDEIISALIHRAGRPDDRRSDSPD
jgi:putative Mg2+ transporter-C (MgtC) family protein